jgi:hypothetical protein
MQKRSRHIAPRHSATLERFLSNDGRRCGPRGLTSLAQVFTWASFAIRSSRSYSAFGDVRTFACNSFTASENATEVALYSIKSRVFYSQFIPALGSTRAGNTPRSTPLHTSHPLTGDPPARVLHNRRSHSALFISDLYVVANELTHRPAVFAAKRQEDAIAFFGLPCRIKTDDD